MHRRIGNQDRLSLVDVHGADHLQHLVATHMADLTSGEDVMAGELHHLGPGCGEESLEVIGQLGWVGRRHRHPAHAQGIQRPREGQRGRRRRKTRLLGQLFGLAVGALPAVDEAARGAGPHHRVHAVLGTQPLPRLAEPGR